MSASVELTSDEVRQVADLVRTRTVGDRLVVVASCDIQFGMARMWNLNLGDECNWPSNVVRTWGEAIDWLESELPDIDFTDARQHD